MFKRLALTAVLAVVGTLLASIPANAGPSAERNFSGTHSCCGGGMYLRSSGEGYIFTSGNRYFGDTTIEMKVWDRREDGLCGRVWLRAWDFWNIDRVNTTATDCDSNPSSYAIRRDGNAFHRVDTFQFTVGRIRQRDGYIDYTRYEPQFLPGS
jgi:hypothetical protein